MRIDKDIRRSVWEKYNGHCAYCGCEITEKEMQVDHIIPQKLGGETKLENLNPACKLCNHYKRSTKLDVWRKYFLAEIPQRLKEIYIVKVALKYGMIEFKEWDKEFYFEKKDMRRNSYERI